MYHKLLSAKGLVWVMKGKDSSDLEHAPAHSLPTARRSQMHRKALTCLVQLQWEGVQGRGRQRSLSHLHWLELGLQPRFQSPNQLSRL